MSRVLVLKSSIKGSNTDISLLVVGITDVDFVYAEGLDIQPDGKEKGLASAHRQITEMVS